MPTTGDFSLYFHVPFCTKKCSYCHFFVLKDNQVAHQTLLEGIKLEFQRLIPLMRGKNLLSIYFGGGTPALIGPQGISTLLELVASEISFDHKTEITLEANPENVSLPLMKGFADVGVNRVSLGVQTFDDLLLKKLGRTHDSERAKRAVLETFEAGIVNLSIDLMYDLPQQSVRSWENTLDDAAKLPITHLSLYNLTIEPKTLFARQKETLLNLLPSPEESLEMYVMAKAKLEAAGISQYEISAFAKKGFFSQHNTGYWLGRPFLGLGPSAFSFWGGKRHQNVCHLTKYANALKLGQSPVDFVDELPFEKRRRELFAIAMRLKQGVVLKAFEARFGNLGDEVRETLSELTKQGLIFQNDDRLCLTDKGVLFYDTFASEVI